MNSEDFVLIADGKCLAVKVTCNSRKKQKTLPFWNRRNLFAPSYTVYSSLWEESDLTRPLLAAYPGSRKRKIFSTAQSFPTSKLLPTTEMLQPADNV